MASPWLPLLRLTPSTHCAGQQCGVNFDVKDTTERTLRATDDNMPIAVQLNKHTQLVIGCD